MDVVCRRACNSSHSGTNFEEEVVDRSVHESEQCCGVSVCSLASVLAVTASLSQVNAICEVVLSDSACDIVKPQTLVFLTRKRNVSEALECEHRLNLERLEGALVNAAFATRRRATRPTPQQSGVPPPPVGALM